MLCLTISHWRGITELSGYFSKKFFSPTETGPAGEKNIGAYLLIATHLAQLSADAFHLVSKGTLFTAQGLGDAAVRNLVIFVPQFNDVVGLRVKLTKALEQLLQKRTVGVDIFHANGFGQLGIKEAAVVVFGASSESVP